MLNSLKLQVQTDLQDTYYLDIINRDYIFNYEYINQKSLIQFIANGINMYKNYITSDDYIFTILKATIITRKTSTNNQRKQKE